MEQEEQYIKKRMVDLSRRASEKGIVAFSNFLNLNELHILHQASGELYSSFQLSGGYGQAERQMVAFLPDALCYAWQYPIDAVRITPCAPKFAENLTHRDILGALMNLGLKREMLGDILLSGSGTSQPFCEATILCVDSISGYIVENCVRIRHTAVACQKIPIADFYYEPTLTEKESAVSSFRLDTVIADICKLPRSAAQKIICDGNAFVNARKIQQNGYQCQDGDILSVRHYGKFQIASTNRQTRKGKLKYIIRTYS